MVRIIDAYRPPVAVFHGAVFCQPFQHTLQTMGKKGPIKFIRKLHISRHPLKGARRWRVGNRTPGLAVLHQFNQGKQLIRCQNGFIAGKKGINAISFHPLAHHIERNGLVAGKPEIFVNIVHKGNHNGGGQLPGKRYLIHIC